MPVTDLIPPDLPQDIVKHGAVPQYDRQDDAMPILRQIFVDAAAVGLVGVGLTAAASGYLHNHPDRVAAQPSAWDEPLMTGSIARRGPADAEQVQEAERVEAEQPHSWIDPPLRAARLARHRPY
ncbi:hypothetical protein [Methylobacterium radiodurans]|uniref:Uncharacterized protein n=1 Tax=Methylobacterium radiodurans TaxID=2202828 RepID=A0A2U8W054_9HYPH|nr:hypothetical protein [Methylobacterium radiodurans]AWN38686.1 hypothetical protein DK427_25600 [Methylobacterium radiodurans]